MSSKRLTKSRTNKKISGVIGGLADYYGWSDDAVTIIRIVYAILALTSFGSLILIYFVASIILPEAPRENSETKQDFTNFSQWSGNQQNKAKKRKDVTPFDDDDEWSQF
ncbi:MAG: PspC domain-containing protein [Lactococcus plantarum]|nr:PspC domain-containing protein [Lactococcus plantarum]MDN6071015.1 PspC domain-containing protein [Lactococcus plantarum]MDN6085235.1 PspC domain-containing protein [Lactococcus plantarum]